uniref:Uncharacterized protein n=1 Tax=Rhizophora mucronata TaxID=61149 RepID=A0A2P2PQH7_RHIMU
MLIFSYHIEPYIFVVSIMESVVCFIFDRFCCSVVDCSITPSL